MAPGRVVDSQWHWYPRAFFEDLLGRTEVPHCTIVGDEYHLEIAPGEHLPFPIAACELDVQIREMDAGGISAAIVSPGSISIESFGPAEAVRLSELLNAQAAAAQAEHPSRIVGAATVPFTAPDAAVTVLDQA